MESGFTRQHFAQHDGISNEGPMAGAKMPRKMRLGAGSYRSSGSELQRARKTPIRELSLKNS